MVTQHESLRTRIEQHKPKNTKSKDDDKAVYRSMNETKEYIEKRFSKQIKEEGFKITFEKDISYKYMHDFIIKKGKRKAALIDETFNDRKIKPDGGILYLEGTIKGVPDCKKPLVIAEIKRQGTNDERTKEGKKKQAVGNAIERLGKNLICIKAMLNYEDITPFVCFGSGCDFTEMTVLSKVSALNEFYPINKLYIFKRDGDSNFNSFSPVSMFFREEEWTEDEMSAIMNEIAETSYRYYTL